MAVVAEVVTATVVPPLQFSDWWLWLLIAAGIVLVLTAWYVLIPRIASPRTTAAPVVVAPPAVSYFGPLGARERAYAAIDLVEQSTREGGMTPREAHIALSAIIRGFAWDMTRIDARTMTLTELKASRLEIIADAVARFYPIAFSEHEPTELGDAADVARGAVTAWR